MNMLGKIDIDKLEVLKADLLAKASDPLMNDALLMIKTLESMIATMTLNHNHYVNWAVDQIQNLERRNTELGWIVNPDRMGGQFTDEELNRNSEERW